MKAENIFKKLICIAGCAAIFSAVSVGSSHAASITASASGKVIAPIVLTKSADLNFGNFASGATSGTVDLTTDGNNTRSKTGGVTLASGVTPTAAVFHVTGEVGSTFSISMDPLTLTSGSNTMAVTLSSTPSGTGSLTSGAADVTVAGSVAVAASQAAGDYSGTLSVTMNYN